MQRIKLLLIIISLVGFYNVTLAQSLDSVKVEMVRNTVSEELVELRDSINLSLQKYDVRIKAVRSSQKKKLQTARKELVRYYDLVELDLVETRTTAQNGWTQDAISRIRTNMKMIRREHERLGQLL